MPWAGMIVRAPGALPSLMLDRCLDVCLLAAAASIVHSGLMLGSIQLGFGYHMWDMRASELLDENHIRLLNSTALVYPIVIFLVKLSMVLMYLRIFSIDIRVRTTIYVGIAVVAAVHATALGLQVGSEVLCVNEEPPTSIRSASTNTLSTLSKAYSTSSRICSCSYYPSTESSASKSRDGKIRASSSSSA